MGEAVAMVVITANSNTAQIRFIVLFYKLTDKIFRTFTKTTINHRYKEP